MTVSDRPLRILHFTGMDCTKFGSVEKWFLAMGRRNDDVKIVLVYNSAPQSEAYVKALAGAGIETEVLPHTLGKIYSNLPAMISLVRKHRPDIVHFHFEYSCLTLGPVLRMMGIPMIKTQHSCLINKNCEQMNCRSDFSVKHRLATLDGLLYRNFKRVICVSDYVAEQYRRVYGMADKILMLPLGLEPLKRRSEEERRELRHSLGVADDEILVSSTLFAVPMKGGDILLEAAALCNNPKLKFMLVGIDPSLPMASDLRHRISELDLDKRFTLVPITDRANDYTDACDIYVQPSRTEALGMAMLEALSLSKPTVASNVGGLPALASRLFEIGDAQALAAHIDALAASDSLRQVEGAEGYKRYKRKYRLEENLDKLIDVYRRIAR